MVIPGKSQFDALLTDKNFVELDKLFKKFNLFTAVGMERYEIRHSNFLATLLDPNSSHGLGDQFLIEFLVRATKEAGSKFSPSDVLLANWRNLKIRREWKNIDLLLIDEDSNFVCCIENKIDSGEHDGQLGKYKCIVDAEFPPQRYPNRLFFYLTPNKNESSHEDYYDIGYETVLTSLNTILERMDSNTGFGYALSQYAELIKEKIVNSEELKELCDRIYKQHKGAIDAIYENSSTGYAKEISDYLRKKIESRKDIFVDTLPSTTLYVRFADSKLESKRWMKSAKNLAVSGNRVLWYEFELRSATGPLDLNMVLASDDHVDAKIREKLIDAVSHFPKTKDTKWKRLLKSTVLSKDDFNELNDGGALEKLTLKIDDFWSRFVTETVPKLQEALHIVE